MNIGSIVRTLLSVLSTVLGAALLLAGWWYAPDMILAVLDGNLAAIKAVCGFLPEAWGSSAETALRIGLGADKALLFAEGSLIFRIVFFGIGLLARAGQHK